MNANEAAQKVIGAAYEVSNALGAGFLEKVYEKALIRELTLQGIQTEAQVRFPIRYKGEPVAEYFADLLIEGVLIVELKCVERFAPEHMATCINYLRASGIKLALLINFQKPRVDWKRVVLEL